ncbi:hypothetical protein WJX73_009564 [Symbiochloris irregularis]|uniref:Calcineurin-like phosphoesterase domain-containing protein n=1 Tax=Symbiochloris irregularis TaxID=706552 RepID=A0AAW1NJ57_9CHLO
MAARGWILNSSGQYWQTIRGFGASACQGPFLVVTASKTRLRQPHRKHLPSRARLTPSGNKLPSPLHAVLAWEKQVKGRTIIVGDVHGCFDELQELLAACSFNSNKDNLIFVGDIVNKGPKSAQVVKFAVEVGAYGVRGNHDDLALHALQYPASQPRKSKMAWLNEFEPEQVQFLDSLPFTLRLEGRDVLIVHAGFKPGRSLPAQRLGDLYSLRVCRPIDTLQSDKVPWASTWTGPQHVFFGHDAVRGLQRHAAATGLDTGCCYGQHLTACILPPLPPFRKDPKAPCMERTLASREDNDNARAFAAAREEVSAKVFKAAAEGKENRGDRDRRSKGFGGAAGPSRRAQRRQPAKLKKWQPRARAKQLRSAAAGR